MMFSKKGITPGDMSLVSLDRIKSIAALPSPKEYTSVGKSRERASRQPVYRQAVITLSHGEQVPVVVKNLSHTGCRIEYFKQVQPEGRVLLIEPSLPLTLWAIVVWRRDGACGLVFEDSDHVDDVMPPQPAGGGDPPRGPANTHSGPIRRSPLRK